MHPETVIAIVFGVVWVVLLAGLVYAYRWFRHKERDTRLPEEQGLAPRLEVFGSAKINQRQWIYGNGCRVSVYEDFLVVSGGSQRWRIPLGLITRWRHDDDERLVEVEALKLDETPVQFRFRGPEAENLARILSLVVDR